MSAELVWFLIGLGLLLLELALPGLVVIFFGIGAWVTALTLLIFEPGLNMQLFIFLASSLLSLALLRKKIKKRFTNRRHDRSADLDNEYVGKTVTALEDFDVNGNGRVSFRGSTWQASCESPVVAGQVLRIVRFDSIHLYLEPLNQSPKTV